MNRQEGKLLMLCDQQGAEYPRCNITNMVHCIMPSDAKTSRDEHGAPYNLLDVKMRSLSVFEMGKFVG